MRQSIKAIYKLTHDTKDAPGIGQREIEVQRSVEGMFFFFDLLLRNGFARANQWLRWTPQQALILCHTTILIVG